MDNIDDILSGAEFDDVLKELSPAEREIFDSMVADIQANGCDDTAMRLLRKMGPKDYLALRCQKCGGTRELVRGSDVPGQVQCGNCGEMSIILPD